MESQPKTQPRGAFQWNAGGWFGAQVGSTCWLLITGLLIGLKDPLAGAVVLACFAVPNVVGWSMWKRRGHLRVYPSIQKLIAVEGLCALVAVAFIHLRDAMRFLPQQSQVSPVAMYGVLLLFPAIMLQFHLQESRARKHRSDDPG